MGYGYNFKMVQCARFLLYKFRETFSGNCHGIVSFFIWNLSKLNLYFITNQVIKHYFFDKMRL